MTPEGSHEPSLLLMISEGLRFGLPVAVNACKKKRVAEVSLEKIISNLQSVLSN